MKELLLGDEAIAQGAIDGGMSGIYAYPGTPSTEITEFVQKNKYAIDTNIRAQWSANEKTAMEAAIGMSYTGKRTMVCMKHVGLNVAADAFMNVAVSGANGGLIVVSADDPSMHSSQNEQDSRYFGNFALMPIFEPSNQQEAYDMAYNAFEFSEKFKIPVLFRITTRIAHSRAGVVRKPQKPQNEIRLPDNPRQFVLLPSNSRILYKDLLAKQEGFIQSSNESIYNKFINGEDKSVGIIASGIAYNYVMEYFGDNIKHPIVKVSQYPAPTTLINELYEECDSIFVAEEGYPLIEESLRGMLNKGKTIKGRLDGTLPRDGELNTNIIKAAFEGTPIEDASNESVMMRPPAMCPGCGHIDMYNAINEVKTKYENARVFSDIGCYTLGALSPYEAIDTCIDMGASITMAKGASEAGLHPAIAVIGDSTFTHSGITGLLDCVNDKNNVTIFISDNSITGMTGQQHSSAYNKILGICEGVGVEPEHIRTIVPLKKNHEEFVKMIEEEINYNGVSVIVPQRECIQAVKYLKQIKK